MVIMKLLICASEYFPHGSGIANSAYNVIEKLKKQGIECSVCSPTGPDITIGNKTITRRFGFLGLAYYWFLVSRNINPKDYDIVWFHNPYFIISNPFSQCLITMQSTYFGLVRKKVGNTIFLSLYYKIISQIEKYCIAKVSKTVLFTGTGKPVCEELEMMGVEKERISYIPNGVDVQPFKPVLNKTNLRKKYRIPEKDIIILSVGRLTPPKRPETMINVFSILEKQNKNLTLVIAGDGELLDSVKALIKKRKLHKVIFLGHVNHLELPDLYACSDFFLITSIYEGGMPPLTLSEAMASGLPCIVSDIPSFHIIEESQCGLTVNFDKINDAATEISEYIMENHYDQSIRARESAVQILDWGVISKQYLTIFQKITGSYY
jgi:1,2-diacylglycerol 3-alpha-glucosyltransferase